MIFTAPRMMKTDYLKVIFFKRLSKYTDNVALINNTFHTLGCGQSRVKTSEVGRFPTK